MRRITHWFWPVLLVTFATGMAFAQATDLPSIGSFEGALPAYWTMGGQPAGATLTWATDQFRSMGHSLKITKTTTSDTASWISTNMCDIWSPSVPNNVDILLGAYVMTSGVNTNPATNDAKWYVAYDFYDTLGAFIGETKLPVNQTTASSTGFVADTNSPGQTVLPKTAYSVIVKFVGGKNATGTVWADDFIFYGRAGQWAGQDWNTSVGVPTGWYYWLPPNGGNDGLLANGFENTRVTTAFSHTGTNSLMFNMPAGRAVHDGFVGTQRIPFGSLGAGSSVSAGDWVRISVWIKATGLFPDSAALYPGTWAVGFTPLFFAQAGNNAGYNPVGPQVDYTFAFPAVTSFDWTQYTLDVQLPTGVGAQYLETRLHVYNQFVGTIYFDDLSVTKIDMPQVAAVGGFEGALPAYWSMGNQPAGATLTWATDQSRSLGHSLKITKTATSDTASWISGNMCDIWSPNVPNNVDILLGAYVMTSGVNTNPATNDAKWYVAYDFYDTLGAFIGETKLPVNQTTASSTGFVADTNSPGQTVLPKTAYKVIVKFVGGKNATGTVWADDFIFYGRAGQWAGQDWNTSVGVPTGWYYWLPPNGGNDGLLANGFENTRVTTAAAHTGTHSLMFNMPAGRAVHDGFVGTQRFAFSGGGWGTNGPMSTVGTPSASTDRPFSVNAQPGDWVRISVWIKASGLFPDSAALYPGTWAVGFTPLFFAQAGNNAGYNPVGPQVDYTFAFPSVTAFDWTQYTLDVQIPTAVGAQFMEVRLHVYNQFVGTVYFDDLDVQKLDVPQVAAVGGFEGTLPAYWTMGGQPAGATLSWATDQYRSMGHSLKITKTATSDTASWISTNMCDIWSPNVPNNVDILLGAYVKTSGVNTNPATNDAKWYVAYDFYDTAGAFIGETKLPVNQSTATSTGFVADTNSPGQTVLPKTAYKVIVKFVGGKNATGTVWADDFIFYGRAGQWAGQDWNTSVGVPTGWYYWLPPNGGNDGLIANGFENTMVTTAYAHTGTHSLMFNMPAGRAVHDGFIGTQRFNFTGTTWGGNGPAGNALATGTNPFGITAKAGDILELSVWIQASGLFPDSAALYPGTWAVGFTPLFFAQAGNNAGYNPVGPQVDYTFLFPKATSFNWTQYKLNVTVPTGVAAQFMEARLHVYNQFVGTVYFDDLNIRVAGTTLSVAPGSDGTPKTFELSNNYPNPFNPTTTIEFGVPHSAQIAIMIYNVLGQRVRMLVDHEQRAAGRYSVVWDGRDDAGSTVGSGMYFYRLETGNVAIVKKMLMLK